MKEAKVEDGNVGSCIEVLDRNGCNLASCEQRCLQEKNGNEICVPNYHMGYVCFFHFNC